MGIQNGRLQAPRTGPTRMIFAADAAMAPVVTDIMLQGAWSRRRQRQQGKPDLPSPWHWMAPRKGWILLKTLVDKLKLPIYGWTSTDSFVCPHHNIETTCTTGAHATFVPPEDHSNETRTVLNSQAAVHKWTMDFPRDEGYRV